MGADVARALLTHSTKTRAGADIVAIADSGASHILFRQSDAHVLHSIEYTRPDMPPFAVLKAANGQELTAIGRGIFSVTKLDVTAFVFSDQDLAANLLGLIPFANAGCTSTFKPYSFHVFPPGNHNDHIRSPNRHAIISGVRPDSSSLWQVSRDKVYITYSLSVLKAISTSPHLSIMKAIQSLLNFLS